MQVRCYCAHETAKNYCGKIDPFNFTGRPFSIAKKNNFEKILTPLILKIKFCNKLPVVERYVVEFFFVRISKLLLLIYFRNK